MNSPNNCKNIQDIRAEIDRIDKEIITALAERLEYVVEAAKYKSDIDAVMAPDRHAVMLKQRMELVSKLNIDPEIVEKVYKLLLDYYKQRQLDIWKEDRKM
jgi:isochorismate pyruvate lyase